MSTGIKMFNRLSLTVFNNNIKRQIIPSGAKSLFTEASIGIDDYKMTRERILLKYGSGIDGFRNKMSEIVNNDNLMVFAEDLKNFGYLVDNTSEELSMLSSLVLKYHEQKSDYRFGVIKLGPIIMRALHSLNQADIAFQLFMNPKTTDFFNQMTSFILLTDLLYENKKYSQVREVYDKIVTLLDKPFHPKLVIIPVVLACYKENTPESLEYGLKIFREIVEKGNIPMKKIVGAIGALALNQKAPHITLEILSQYASEKYISIRSLRLIALAELDRLDNIFIELQMILQYNAKYNQLYKDVIPRVQEALNHKNTELNSELPQLLEKLKFGGYVSEVTLDEHLSMPIEIQPKDNNRILSSRAAQSSYNDQSDHWGPKSFIKQNY